MGARSEMENQGNVGGTRARGSGRVRGSGKRKASEPLPHPSDDDDDGDHGYDDDAFAEAVDEEGAGGAPAMDESLIRKALQEVASQHCLNARRSVPCPPPSVSCSCHILSVHRPLGPMLLFAQMLPAEIDPRGRSGVDPR